ncbi:MAG: hypothetical protein KDA37_10345 [Planctomycetales bacterium]|nr:hypothetical protein [Planctomycetales bacterium]
MLRTAVFSLALLLACVAMPVGHDSQCSACPQAYSAGYAPAPYTVGYAPTAYTAAYPPVQQTVVTNPGWYPGKFIRRLFGWGDPGMATAYTTAYQPTYPPSYSVGYAPSAYTVGYAPSAYTVGYAANYSAGYAPTSCYRPVTLEPCCNQCQSCCSGGCDSCSGVATAGYTYGGGSDCPNCAGGGGQGYQDDYYQGYESSPSNSGGPSPTPAPYIDPNSQVPESRNTNRPESEAAGQGGQDAKWFHAPQLYDPQDRTAARQPTAPVWNAVYRDRGELRQVSAQKPVARQPAAGPQHQKLDASGWTSVGR